MKNIIETPEKDKGERSRVSSKGKRLFSFLLDFIFALLFANTLSQISRKEHWDLAMQSRNIEELIPFYGSLMLVIVFKDIFGCSLGKFLLGMKIRSINDLSKSPSFPALLLRNLLLLIFPLEGIILLRDAYARRFSDKFFNIVVLDEKKTIRPVLRILLGNIILFGFFSIAIFLQRSSIEKTAVYQKAEEVIRNHSSLRVILEKFPVIEELEMHLDFRGSIENPSIVRVRVGDEEFGKMVKVLLIIENNKKKWRAVDLEIKPIGKKFD